MTTVSQHTREPQNILDRVRFCLTPLKNCFMCSCFKKSPNDDQSNDRGFGDQDITRLPVRQASFHSTRMIPTATLLPAERWTSVPTYINIPTPPPLPPQRTHKRRSSPGRLDSQTVEKIIYELGIMSNYKRDDDLQLNSRTD